MTRIRRRDLLAAVAERATVITHATGYVGKISAATGLPGVDTPEDPPTKDDGTGRVRPYFVLFPGIGRPGDEQAIDDVLFDLAWPLQVTAAAGDTDDLLALVDRIDAALHRWAPGFLAGADGVVVAGPLRIPDGYVPPVLTDRTVRPERVYTPLQYQLTAHT
ncbi:hypothetical protein QWY28_13245 [Nocardioides sp. SOB77]|uniref:Uncharacterized protein n=1 Tax=Nocardioides oceani TaxID=3058369 RepID=A0ABT8FHB6_9ACTN|nr:hypothetical protein [Nocardioides oceani]MDN4173920.1 hypothetical protein [Nocardioides oceani]